jgi:four helix bundle protein
VYVATATFPQNERFGLTSQIRRAAISIPANIVEGRLRGGDREFGRFLKVALGSAGELEYYVLLASDLALLSEVDRASLAQAIVEVKRMLAGFVRKLTSISAATSQVLARSDQLKADG